MTASLNLSAWCGAQKPGRISDGLRPVKVDTGFEIPQSKRDAKQSARGR